MGYLGMFWDHRLYQSKWGFFVLGGGQHDPNNSTAVNSADESHYVSLCRNCLIC